MGFRASSPSPRFPPSPAKSAKLTVGGEIPIPGPSICAQNTGCTGGGAIFQPYGVTLGFSPVVLSEGRILLRLATEVTEIDNTTG
jgi:pilus assembly protein CpaC